MAGYYGKYEGDRVTVGLGEALYEECLSMPGVTTVSVVNGGRGYESSDTVEIVGGAMSDVRVESVEDRINRNIATPLFADYEPALKPVASLGQIAEAARAAHAKAAGPDDLTLELGRITKRVVEAQNRKDALETLNNPLARLLAGNLAQERSAELDTLYIGTERDAEVVRDSGYTRVSWPRECQVPFFDGLIGSWTMAPWSIRLRDLTGITPSDQRRSVRDLIDERDALRAEVAHLHDELSRRPRAAEVVAVEARDAALVRATRR